MIGHIKVDRKILNWEWFKDIKVFHLFLYFLLKANHKDGKWQGKEIKRGQLITGRTKLNGETGLSEREIRTCIYKLKKTGEITIQTTSKFTIITICKYEYYQKKYNDDDQQNDQQIDQRKTNERPTNDQQTTTNNNDNNDNNDKKSVNGTHILEKSNLFRQPNIPSKNQVWEVFSKNGGTKEMAKSFFETHESTGWFYKGSPITNFSNLIPKYIEAWKKNDRKDKPQDSTSVKIVMK